VSDELDISRLATLQELVGSSVAQIVETLVTELDRALEGVEGALGEGDLRAAALAAHAARNSALMIDSQPLLRGLDALEQSARDDDLAGAQAAQGRLQQTWPAIRVELERAAG
jgi:hypothetical protein